MSDITERATELAKAHPVGEVLENTFFGFFKVVGLVLGSVFRAVNWVLFHGYTLIFVIWLAFQDGFKQTAGLRVPPRGIEEGQQAAPPLLADPRYQDPNTTPFGVPYGPNVHASHE